jgi:beta-lactamase regulating signal transducer with metallopeptidase domain
MNVVMEVFLNTIWQTAIVALLAWAVLRWLPRINAATRVAVWWAVLAFIVMLPVLRILPGETPAIISPVAPAVSGPATFDSPREPVAEAPVAHVTTPKVVPPPGSWPILFLALWCAFCIAQCARLAFSYLHLRRLKHTGRPASRERQANFDAWMMTCGIRRTVRLLISNRVSIPVAIGFQHPAVVLPEALLDRLTPAELDHVLLHELAHIARRDDWTNLLARIAWAALALHPVAAWVLRQIDRERELACDDWVVAATGAARPYAASLARLFELCTSRRSALLASGIADGGSQLGNRIAMLLRRGRQFNPQASALRVSLCGAAMLILVVAGAHTPTWIAFGQARRPTSQAEADALEKSTRAPEPAPRTAATAPRAPQVSPKASQPATPAPEPAPSAPEPTPRNSLLAALVANGYGDLSVGDIIQLKVQGVSPDFIAGIAHSGIGKLPPRELIDLKVQGVNPDYITEILALGFGPLTYRQFIDFKVQGVPVELFRALKDCGFLRAAPNEIIEAKLQGLDPGYLREARKFGPNLTLRQIVRMKQAGIL